MKCTIRVLYYCILEYSGVCSKCKNVGPGPVTIPQCGISTPWNALKKCTSRQSPDSKPVNHQYVLVIQNMLANKTRSVHQYVLTFFDFPDYCPVGLRENPVICPVKQTWCDPYSCSSTFHPLDCPVPIANRNHLGYSQCGLNCESLSHFFFLEYSTRGHTYTRGRGFQQIQGHHSCCTLQEEEVWEAFAV